MTHKPLEYYMTDNVYITPPTEEDNLFLDCVTAASKKYHIHLASATPEERQFVFDRAEEMLREKVAV